MQTLLELFVNRFLLRNEKAGDWCLRKNIYLCSVFVCVVVLCVGDKSLLHNLLCASTDALPTNRFHCVFGLAG